MAPGGLLMARWRVALLAALSLATVSVAGCSGGGGSPAPSTTTSPPETTTTTSVAIESGEQHAVYVPTVGDCFDRRLVEQASGSGMAPLALVFDCALPHSYEVFSVLTFPGARSGAPYPEDEALRTYARSACLDGFEAYVGEPYETSELDIDHYVPSRSEWAAGAQAIGCSLVDMSGEKLVGSARGSGR